jgi:hypothetical protein
MWGHNYIFFLFFAVKTGSFVYDVNIGLDNWQPSQVRMCMCAHACVCTLVCVHMRAQYTTREIR